MACSTRRDAPSKWTNGTGTPPLSTLIRAFGFPTDENAERQCSSVDRAEIKLASVDTSNFLLFLMPAIMPTYRVKNKNGPYVLRGTRSWLFLSVAHMRKVIGIR